MAHPRVERRTAKEDDLHAIDEHDMEQNNSTWEVHAAPEQREGRRERLQAGGRRAQSMRPGANGSGRSAKRSEGQ